MGEITEETMTSSCQQNVPTSTQINIEKGKCIIIDPVLAYCASFLKNYSVADVVEALMQFFREDIVVKARDTLREAFAEKLNNFDIVKISHRRSSSSRTSFEANARDVAEAAYLLINEDEGPKFLIEDVSKLPILTPSLANPRNQAESILMLEKKLQKIEMRMTANDEILKQHDEELMRQKDERNEKGLPLSAYGSLSMPVPAQGENSWKKSVPEIESMKFPEKATDNKQNDIKQDNDISWSTIVKQPQTKPEVENWQGVQKDKKKMFPVRKRPATLQGTARETGIKAGKGPNRDIWIYNVDKDITDDAMKKYIEGGGSTKKRTVDIRLWEPRYKENHESKCFRLTIAKSDYEYVFKPEFWPIDIGFRKYWLSKREMSSLKGILESIV